MCKTKDIRVEIKEYIEYNFKYLKAEYLDYSIQALTMSFLLGLAPNECVGMIPEDLYPEEDMEIYDVAYECVEALVKERR